MGCIFVLLPQNSLDAAKVKSNLMGSLKLKNRKKTSPRFFRVLVAPESIDLVKKTMKQNGFPENLVTEYFQFLTELENL